jgi:hypothetical protein
LGSWPHILLWSAPFTWQFAHSSMELVVLGFASVDSMHASCGPLSIFGGQLWSIHLGGIFYCYISHAPWRVHLVSSFRWNFEHILLVWRLILYHACIHSWRDNSSRHFACWPRSHSYF